MQGQWCGLQWRAGAAAPRSTVLANSCCFANTALWGAELGSLSCFMPQSCSLQALLLHVREKQVAFIQHGCIALHLCFAGDRWNVSKKSWSAQGWRHAIVCSWYGMTQLHPSALGWGGSLFPAQKGCKLLLGRKVESWVPPSSDNWKGNEGWLSTALSAWVLCLCLGDSSAWQLEWRQWCDLPKVGWVSSDGETEAGSWMTLSEGRTEQN